MYGLCSSISEMGRCETRAAEIAGDDFKMRCWVRKGDAWRRTAASWPTGLQRDRGDDVEGLEMTTTMIEMQDASW